MSEKVFCIYDVVAKRAGPLFTVDTVGEAERQFLTTIQRAQEGSLFKSHPQDYELWMIGEYDIHSPSLMPSSPMRITSGADALIHMQNATSPLFTPLE